MKKKIIALLLLLTMSLTACRKDVGGENDDHGPSAPGHDNNSSFDNNIGNDDSTFGEDLKDLGAFDGYFEEEISDFKISCVSGTSGCYKVEGNVITFTNVREESVYAISGRFSGSIVIDTGDAHKFDLELSGFSLVCDDTNPITVLSGDEVSIQAKKDTENYIYDMRSTISEDDTTSLSSAIHSSVDLELSGKGKLTVISQGNNGIHSKKDLQVKNLSLTVSAKDNALKGNDSVQFEAATATLISTIGDCIKTTKTDISEKGNQRGTVSFEGGSYNIYAACDGIDAAYNVTTSADSVINIYTDKYSNYSEEVVEVAAGTYYIRNTNSSYKYSVKYYNSEDDFIWVNPEHHSTVQGGRNTYYFYSFAKNADYAKIRIYAYSSGMQQGQDSEYAAVSDFITLSTAYDTFSVKVYSKSISCDLTNYSTKAPAGGPGFPGGGPGGMMDGNSDKGDHSTKGIKAANEIIFNGGSINIKSYDDALHAKNDVALENGQTALGRVTVNDGTIVLYTNDDAIHADGMLVVNGGTINVVNSYEGIEGETVKILGGTVYIVSKDDGINASMTSGTTITIGGGLLYIFCGGDGIDSNSRASYSGIAFTGGKTVIVSTSGGNSAIDSEQGYSFSGGYVVAIMPRGGMSGEATHCQNFASVGKNLSLSLTKGQYIICDIGGQKLTLNMPATISASVVLLGSGNATATASATSSYTLSEGEFMWD